MHFPRTLRGIWPHGGANVLFFDATDIPRVRNAVHKMFMDVQESIQERMGHSTCSISCTLSAEMNDSFSKARDEVGAQLQ
jgi:prepilin-type processing-associated H-X9-DG protein